MHGKLLLGFRGPRCLRKDLSKTKTSSLRDPSATAIGGYMMASLGCSGLPGSTGEACPNEPCEPPFKHQMENGWLPTIVVAGIHWEKKTRGRTPSSCPSAPDPIERPDPMESLDYPSQNQDTKTGRTESRQVAGVANSTQRPSFSTPQWPWVGRAPRP